MKAWVLEILGGSIVYDGGEEEQYEEQDCGVALPQEWRHWSRLGGGGSHLVLTGGNR